MPKKATKVEEPRFHIMDPGMWDNEASSEGSIIRDWYAVVDEEQGGIVAYAGSLERAQVIMRALTAHPC